MAAEWGFSLMASVKRSIAFSLKIKNKMYQLVSWRSSLQHVWHWNFRQFHIVRKNFWLNENLCDLRSTLRNNFNGVTFYSVLIVRPKVLARPKSCPKYLGRKKDTLGSRYPADCQQNRKMSFSVTTAVSMVHENANWMLKKFQRKRKFKQFRPLDKIFYLCRQLW